MNETPYSMDKIFSLKSFDYAKFQPKGRGICCIPPIERIFGVFGMQLVKHPDVRLTKDRNRTCRNANKSDFTELFFYFIFFLVISTTQMSVRVLNFFTVYSRELPIFCSCNY